MKQITNLLLLFLCIFSMSFQTAIGQRKFQADSTQSKIKEVKSTNEFQQKLQTTDSVVVYIYMAYCPACQRVERDKILQKLSDKNPYTSFLKVNKTLSEVVKDLKVSAFPTFIFFKNNKEVSRVTGARPIDSYQKEINKLISPVPPAVAKSIPAPTKKPGIIEQPTPVPIQTAPTPGQLIDVQSDCHFQELLKQPKYKILDFYTVWCGPCKNLKPVLERLAQEYTQVLFISVNAEKFCEPARRYGVAGYPTMVILDPQNKVVRKDSGFGAGPAGEAMLKNRIDQAVGGVTGRGSNQVILREEVIRIN